NEVVSSDPNNPREYKPFYSFRHEGTPDNSQAFWYGARVPSVLPNDRGTEVYLHFVDLAFNPKAPPEEVLVVRTLCTNRDLPAKLIQAGENLYFELEQAAPLERVRCVRTPTPPLRPPLRRGLYWRLFSHLSLNHLSIAQGSQGRDAL